MRFRLPLIIMTLYILVLTHSVRTQTKPNILIIVVDDQGYADLSAYPNSVSDINTPNMDRLAQDGVLLTNAYVSAPVSSPSRAGWNTGLYQQRWDFNAGWNPGMPDSVKSIAEYMKEDGYKTAKIGKNDLGKGYFSHDAHEYPLNHGFDNFLGFSAHAHDFFLLSQAIADATPDPNGASAHLGPLMHNRGYKSYNSGYTTEIFTDSALQFMEKHTDDPFFLVLSYNAVHHLIHEVPQKYLDKYNVNAIPNYDPQTMGRYNTYYNKYNKLDPITNSEMRKYYLANLNCLDDNIGRVLDKMDNLGITDSTLVIYFSDNGGSPLTGANNSPLRGSKYVLFEGGLKVPFIMRWPGRIPKGKVYDYRVSTLDIVPTICAAAGITLGGNEKLDGHSFLDAVIDNAPSHTHGEPMFWKFQNQIAVLHNDWKFAQTNDYTSRQPTNQIIQGPDNGLKERLYSLTNDPAEQNDLFNIHPDTVLQMKELISRWEADLLGFSSGSGIRVDDKSGLIKYSGTWKHNASASGNYLFTNTSSKTKNDKAEFSFTGTGIKLYVQKGKAAGIFDIYIDGNPAGSYDGYASSTQTMQLAFSDTTLVLGVHTIRINVRGENSGSSTDFWANIDFFEYYDTSSTSVMQKEKYSTPSKILEARPSPDKRYINFLFNTNASDGILRIFDLSGRQIEVFNEIKRSVSWKFLGMKSGIYLVHYKSGKSEFSKKFMLIR